MPNTESSLNKENSDLLNLSKAQSNRRRKATIEVLREIHCTPRSILTDNKPVMSGMWSTLVNDSTPQLMESLITTSKLCASKVIPSIVKKGVQNYETSQENFVRSTALLYKGGILTKRKYKEIRKEMCNFLSDVPMPQPVAYDRLITYIKSINMGDVLDLLVRTIIF